MKVLGIVCSPRKGGNTEIMVEEALTAAREAGAETELVAVAAKNIAPCDGCDSCRVTGICKIDDDMQMIYERLEKADAVIFGTPVYFRNVTAQAKTVMDRTYVFMGKRNGGVKRLRDKVAGGIVVARRVGAGQVRDLLASFFLSHGMIIAGVGIGYGRDKGEVRQGVGALPGNSALDEARAVGRDVVRMLKMLSKSSGVTDFQRQDKTIPTL